MRNISEEVCVETAIIMSTYAGDDVDQFKDAVDSILRQTYQNFDLIVHFDGPVDSKVEDYLLALSSKIVILKSVSNVGLSRSLNSMINYCLADKYSFIARMDSDDIAVPDRIEVQINHLQKNSEISILGTYCSEFGSIYAADLKKVPIGYDAIRKFSIYRCPLIHPTVVFRRHVFESGLRYPENYPYTEDMALWLECIDNGIVIDNIPYIGLKYRLTENAIRRRLSLKKGLTEFRLRTKFLFSKNNFSLKAFIYIAARPFFHLLPFGIVKYLYKYAR